MKIHSIPAWLSSEVQSHIKPPPIPLIKAAIEYVSKSDIIKINMCWNPSSADLKTYRLKIATFKTSNQKKFWHKVKIVRSEEVDLLFGMITFILS